jgi:F420-dependent oxidoreductase-like protein
MRIGTAVALGLDGPQTIDEIVDEVRRAAELGLAGAWWAQVFSWDALTALTVAGLSVPDLPLGTAVVTTYPRHPMALAGQALSTQAAIGNRLTLGIGPSHKPAVEATLGMSFDRPAQHTREYLQALVPLLRGEAVDVDGEIHHAHGQITVPGAEPPSVLVAALGPVMLRTAGELADGTIATWTGVRTVGEHIVPRITAAASAAGRPAPRVVLSLPIAVTGDADGARRWIAERLGMAGDLPSYRAMLDIEGASGPEDVVIVGDETAVERQLARFEDAGATELVAVPFGPADQVARTLNALADLHTVPAASP